MRLAVVVLNYRTPALTVQCLRSLLGQLEDGDVAVVVDNASGDGSADEIDAAIHRECWRRVRQIRSTYNLGFAGGNNLAIRSTRADLYLLLNSDTIVLPGAIGALRDATRRRPEAGLVGPRFSDGERRPSQSTFRMLHPVSELVRAASTGPLTRLFPRFELPLPAGDQPAEAEWIGFACALVRREVIERIGLLDERYFLYFEDIDYCRRARAAGWTILYWPAAHVVHLEGGSSTMRTDRRLARAPRYYYASRARYFAKFHGRSGLLAANLLWTAGHAFGWARAAIDGRRPPCREREALDIWTDALRPIAAGAALEGGRA